MTRNPGGPQADSPTRSQSLRTLQGFVGQGLDLRRPLRPPSPSGLGARRSLRGCPTRTSFPWQVRWEPICGATRVRWPWLTHKTARRTSTLPPFTTLANAIENSYLVKSKTLIHQTEMLLLSHPCDRLLRSEREYKSCRLQLPKPRLSPSATTRQIRQFRHQNHNCRRFSARYSPRSPGGAPSPLRQLASPD